MNAFQALRDHNALIVTAIFRWLSNIIRNPSAVAVLVLGVMMAWPAHAVFADTAVVYVNMDREWPSTEPENGTSWVTAFRFLQDAINRAEELLDLDPPPPAVEIWVAQGEYRTDQSLEHDHCDENEPPGWPDCCPPWGDCGWSTGSFVLLDNVGIFGGFDGTETLRSERKPLENITIPTGPAASIVASYSNDNTARLDGFHIIGDFVVDGFPTNGRGIDIYDSSPVISNCTIAKTSSGDGTAAQVNYYSDAQFINCVFKHNQTHPSSADLIWVLESSKATFVNCLFHGNVGAGGAIHAWFASEVALVNCTVANNIGQHGLLLAAGSTSRRLIRHSVSMSSCSKRGRLSAFVVQ